MTKWVAKGATADGHHLYLWPDGALTWALGQYVKGSAHPRTPDAREQALRAGFLVLGDAAIYDDAEVPDLVEAARWAARTGATPAAMRKRIARRTRKEPRPHWVTQSADRDGKPTTQVWRPNRLRFPGMVIYRERQVYSIWYERPVGSSTAFPSGVEFRTLREVLDHLDAYPGAGDEAP
jgi:hypothetical protein